MLSNWFEPCGWLHRPRNLAGYMVTLAAIAFMLQVFFAVDSHSHSASDTLYGIYPFWGVTFLGWDWLAQRTTQVAKR